MPPPTTPAAWQKLFVRKDCDLPTFSAAIQTAYDILWRFSRRKREYLFALLQGRNIHYYLHGIDALAPGRALYRRRFATPEQVRRSYQNGLKLLQRTRLQTSERQALFAARQPDRSALAAAFAEFVQSFWAVNYGYSILPWWALEAWQYDFQQSLARLIERRGLAERREEILNTVTKGWKRTAIEEVQRKFSAGTSAARLAKEYQFLRSWTLIWHKPLNAEWARSVGQKSERTGVHGLTAAQALRLLRPNRAEASLLRAAPYIIFFKDWRDDLRRQHAFLWNPLFQAISRCLGIPYDDLGYLTLDEIAAALASGQVDRKIIARRAKHGCVLTVIGKELQVSVIEGDSMRRYLAISQGVEQAGTEQTIRGIVGQPGVVRGLVRTIRHYKDVFKVRTGDILVANTTHPNYVPGMKLAAAFVTDEGGIACHAAIVARELGKPCIVGTKIATKALKDGDRVEVDANKGVVRKMK